MYKKSYSIVSIVFFAIFFMNYSVHSQNLEPGGQPLTSKVFDLAFTNVAPGIWVADRPNFWRVPIVGNIIIIEGENEVMLFDGGRGLQTAVQLINFIKTNINKPLY